MLWKTCHEIAISYDDMNFFVVTGYKMIGVNQYIANEHIGVNSTFMMMNRDVMYLVY